MSDIDGAKERVALREAMLEYAHGVRVQIDELSDEEFEREVLDSLDQATTKISLRVPNDLLGRTKQAAEHRGVPYQS